MNKKVNLFDSGGFLSGDSVHFEAGFGGGRLSRFLVMKAIRLQTATVRRVGRRLLAAVAVAGDFRRSGRRHSTLFEFHVARRRRRRPASAHRHRVLHFAQRQIRVVADHVQTFQ